MKQIVKGHKSPWIISLLLAVLLMAGCSVSGGQESQPSAALPSASQAPQEEEMEHMLPILEGIALCMEGGEAYDQSSAQGVWGMLYYIAYNNGAQGQDAVLGEDGTLTVSAGLMERYAAACFENMEELPEIPDSLRTISYQEQERAYLLEPSDKGPVYGKIYTAEKVTEGLYRVTLNLYGEDDSPIEQYEYTLVDNPLEQDGQEPSYAYAVRSANKVVINPGNLAR